MKKISHTLRRKEIVRGFESFENILTKGTKLDFGNLTAFVAPADREVTKSDLFLRVGFLLSKKKLKNLTIETS